MGEILCYLQNLTLREFLNSHSKTMNLMLKFCTLSKKSPIIPIRNFKEKDYVAYGGEIFL